MATTPDLALLALRVYSTPLASDPNPLTRNTELNRPAVPTGWVELEWHPDEGGFSYGVYRNGAEIVISYTGTNEGLDWATNGANGFGLGSTQTTKAALAYLQAKQQYGSNITFTGHSLGGGLASIMAVWFDRPAVVFDEAPFEIAARNPLIILATKAALTLAGYDVGAFAGYTGILDFLTRETQVTNHYMEGEALYYLRAAWPTVMGNGQDNPVRANIADMSGLGGPVDLHSQALLTAMIVSDAFRLATYASSRVIPLLMDKSFYAISTQNTAQENVLIKFIRSEQGTGDILTHFAADLQKLGTNIAGLNVAAQNAIIAQGIEWYYWQGTNYAGQEFFTQTGNFYQYTSAQGAGLAGAQNKAASYATGWIATVREANGAAFSPMGIVNYDQWNIVAGDTATTATAKDATKSQIYVGGGGADNFTGGNLGDVILAGAGNDTINGGLGNDQLYGGAGTDTYLFSGAWGNDTITDSDGLGSIKIGDASAPALTGGKKLLDNVWESDDHSVIYTLTGPAGAQSLIIGQRTTPGAATVSGTITVQGWVNGQLGITLDGAPAVANPALQIQIGDQTSPNYADVLYGSAAADQLLGLGGNDALGGGAGVDILLGEGRKCAVKRHSRNYRNRSCSCYVLLGWRHKRHVEKSDWYPKEKHTHLMRVRGEVQV
jgi:RTX calcium-binding nonapeptide repeat (4 copies)/Lipase (class 3)